MISTQAKELLRSKNNNSTTVKPKFLVKILIYKNSYMTSLYKYEVFSSEYKIYTYILFCTIKDKTKHIWVKVFSPKGVFVSILTFLI